MPTSNPPLWLENNLPHPPGRPPLATSQADVDALVRMVAGEAGGESPSTQQAVAGVAINRALLTGRAVKDICTEPLANGHLQFDGYNNPYGRAALPGSDTYKRVWANIARVVTGGAPNPAGNATFFRSVQDPEHPSPPQGYFQKLPFIGSIGKMLFYGGGYGTQRTPPPDPVQPFGGDPLNGAPFVPAPPASAKPPTPESGPVHTVVTDAMPANGQTGQASLQALAASPPAAAGDPHIAALGVENAQALARLLATPGASAAGMTATPSHELLADAVQAAGPPSQDETAVEPALLAALLARGSGSASAYG